MYSHFLKSSDLERSFPASKVFSKIAECIDCIRLQDANSWCVPYPSNTRAVNQNGFGVVDNVSDPGTILVVHHLYLICIYTRKKFDSQHFYIC